MTAYQRGNAFERRVADDLRADGYVVYQSRGSKTPVDIVACKPGQVLFVQVKGGLPHGNVSPISGEAWNALFEIAAKAGAIPILATRATRGVIRYQRLLAAHRAHARTWALADWTPDDVELAAAITRHPAGRRR